MGGEIVEAEGANRSYTCFFWSNPDRTLSLPRLRLELCWVSSQGWESLARKSVDRPDPAERFRATGSCDRSLCAPIRCPRARQRWTAPGTVLSGQRPEPSRTGHRQLTPGIIRHSRSGDHICNRAVMGALPASQHRLRATSRFHPPSSSGSTRGSGSLLIATWDPGMDPFRRGLVMVACAALFDSAMTG